ncbi:hypothetical protein KB553_09545 [Chryseobacterium rhizoplanae]|uniref:hypothetical protein n=1 Tax=Chryseobacterium rhizoplanae TaxID=1609531 RepID=UPI001CE30EFF|nr:hypothetical protein [Chryseobacterium rhizoplanae]UCA61757.1 hypothetical protein KB553_09545 [Chryseobacterium rhizoplanae]
MQKIFIIILSGISAMSCSNTSCNGRKLLHMMSQNIHLNDTVRSTENQNVHRTVANNVITRIVDMHKFPIEIEEEFTKENQKLVLQLMNARRTKISGRIVPESDQMNIRFNNIELNKQSIDGPFGRDFEYELNQTGDYSIVIQKSLMASGSQIGKFKILLK